MAAAIVAEAAVRSVKLLPSQKFQSFPGRGVTGSIAEEAVALGNRQLLDDLKLDPAALEPEADRLRIEADELNTKIARAELDLRNKSAEAAGFATK